MYVLTMEINLYGGLNRDIRRMQVRTQLWQEAAFGELKSGLDLKSKFR
jgi:hypothetical protein